MVSNKGYIRRKTNRSTRCINGVFTVQDFTKVIFIVSFIFDLISILGPLLYLAFTWPDAFPLAYNKFGIIPVFMVGGLFGMVLQYDLAGGLISEFFWFWLKSLLKK